MTYMANPALNIGWTTTGAEHLLDLACESAPVLRRTLAEFGDVPLATYLRNLVPGGRQSWQDKEDLLEAVVSYTAPLLGQDIAVRTARELGRHPMALTANHHGVDYFSQSVQGTLLFSLLKTMDSSGSSTVPVLSCGNIPMNNLTYPLGMLFYGVGEDLLESAPKRAPIFPDRCKRTMVCTAGGFDMAMVERAVKRIEAMSAKREIRPGPAACAREILMSEYADPRVMGLPSYSDQSVVLNHRLWKRLFAQPESAPDVVVLELEKLVAMVLQSDLRNEESLAWRVMFDRELRRHVLTLLDGQRVCWTRKNLDRRMCAARGQGGDAVPASGCGTLFFWGIDSSGRKVPLTLERDSQSGDRLRGVDDRGEIREFPFTPEGLAEGLLGGRLIPSLFTCYLAVSLARGVVCLGGYYQAEYLPAIQHAIVSGLNAMSRYRSMAEFVGGVTTDGYLSGMQTVMTEVGDGRLAPAGLLEIMAGGGLTGRDVHRIGALTVREAHLASLSETLPDIGDGGIDIPLWKSRVASDCHVLLAGRIVRK